MSPDIGPTEKWLRIATSVGALYLGSGMHGAIVPLLSNLQWAAKNTTLDSSSIFPRTGKDINAQASFTASALFFSTGAVEMVLSPVAGIAADWYGLDLVVLTGILLAVIKCLLYGLLDLTVPIVLVNRIIQGVLDACTQTLTMARIRDLYEDESAESTNVMAVGFCGVSFSLLSGLFTGKLFKILEHRVFFLFLPVAFLLIVGVLITFRMENFHSRNEKDKQSRHRENVNDQSLAVQWRVLLDVQIMVISLCFLIVTLGQTALEPSVAMWLKSTFGAGPSSTAGILGFCGLATLISSFVSAQILPKFPERSWVLCTATLFTTGLPLMLMRYSPNLAFSGVALCVHFFSANAARFVFINMCSTIAETRYPEAYGLVFAMANVGWGCSFLVGPLLASFLFGTICVICLMGVACILAITFVAATLRKLDSDTAFNCMDCCAKEKHTNQGYEIVSDVQIPLTFESITLPVQVRN